MAQIEGFENAYVGLSPEEYEDNLDLFGYNALEKMTTLPLFRRMVNRLASPAFLLLCVAAAALFILHDFAGGSILLVLALALYGAELYLDIQADKDALALYTHCAPSVKTVRQDQCIMVPAREIVPNDIIVLHKGERVPADAVTLECQNLSADEHALTEFSTPAHKQRGDTIYAGSILLSGRCIAKVTATGTRTAPYKSGRVETPPPERPASVQRKGTRIRAFCTVLSVVLVLPAFLVVFQRTSLVGESITAALTLALALIPAQLAMPPAALLNRNALRLANSGAVLRRPSFMRKLGTVTAICMDMNAAPSQEQMEVCDYLTTSDETLAHIACLASVQNSALPMEHAVLHFCEKSGADVGMLHSNLLIHEYPFDKVALLTARIWRVGDTALLCVKGMPEHVLPQCGLEGAARYAVRAKQSEMERQGLRVLCVAYATIDVNIPESVRDCKLTYVGLIGISAPPPKVLTNAALACRRAGIRAVMLTADNPDTAMSIAEKIGVDISGGMITAKMLENTDERDLAQLAHTANVFTGISPEQKPKIIKALKAAGEMVATVSGPMRDVPLMEEADVPCAGKESSPAIRDNAQVILPDERMISAVRAIGEARQAMCALLHMMISVAILHAPMILLALWAILSDHPSTITPASIVLPQLVLTAAYLLLPPKPNGRDMLLRPADYLHGRQLRMLALWSVLQAGALCGAGLGGCFMLRSMEADNGVIAGFMLVLLLTAALTMALVGGTQLSLFTRPAWRGSKRLLALGGGLLLIAIVAFFPPAHLLFGTTFLPVPVLLSAMGLGMGAIAWQELIKLFGGSLRERLARFFTVLFHGKQD